MKLYNKTPINNDLLKRILTVASQAAGSNSLNTIVTVTPTQGYSRCRVHGMAHNSAWVSDTVLSGKSNRKITCSGWIQLFVPNTTAIRKWEAKLASWEKKNPWHYDWLDLAEIVYSIAVHEWAHIKDYQNRVWHDPKQRTKRHDARPWEKTAIRCARSATKKIAKNSKKQDLIIELALELERLTKEAK